jgi:transcriptional regulator with XRE-family HTH domain
VLTREAIGLVLRDTREAQGLTMRSVSETSSVALGYISELERGHKEASSEILVCLCEALGIQVSDLLHGAADLLALDELFEKRAVLPENAVR